MLSRYLRHPATMVVTGLLGLFLLYELGARFFAYAGDSYVNSNVVTVSAQIDGPVSQLAVENNQSVVEGHVLFRIDPEPFALKVAAARSALAQTQAELGLAQDEVAAARAGVGSATAVEVNARAVLDRMRALGKDGFSTEAGLDVAVRDLATARAAIDSAEAAQSIARRRVVLAETAIASAQAALEKAEYDLSKTVVSAPVAGRVTPFETRVGDYVKAGSKVLAVVTGERRRVVATVAERHLARARVGQRAWVTLGSEPWVLHYGTVTGISAGVARSQSDPGVMPYVAPSTDWVRLPRRFPVEITLDKWPQGQPLYVGADARVLIWF